MDEHLDQMDNKNKSKFLSIFLIVFEEVNLHLIGKQHSFQTTTRKFIKVLLKL